MMINLNSIDKNPNRDFGLDPIDPDKVTQLAESIGKQNDKDALGFWGGIVVRPSAGNRFELAFGHHRLAALKQAGWKKADINIINYDENKMLKAMVKENLTQRGSEGGAATESVAAVIRHLGYKLLTMTNDELLAAKIFAVSKTELTKTRNIFLNGNGFSERAIHAYEKSLPIGSIRNALKTLRDSSWMFNIVTHIKDRIHDEIIEAKKAAKKLKIKKEKEEAQKKIDELEKQEQDAADAAEASKREQHFDPLVEAILKRESHITMFRDIVTDINGKKYIPLDQQVPLAEAILDDAAHGREDKNDEDGTKITVTGSYVRKNLMAVLREAMAMDRKAKKKIEIDEQNAAATHAWTKLDSGVQRAITNIEKLTDAIDKKGWPDNLDSSDIQTFFSIHVNNLKQQLDALDKKMNLNKKVVSIQ